MLEAMDHADNAFITLTYKDVPEGNSLQPRDIQKFIKRLRKAYEPGRFRYFLVGEYGDQTHRPHYHAALFGYPCCRFGYSRFSRVTNRCCASCDGILSNWGNGLVSVGTLSPESAAYIAGYVTKKMTGVNDERLEGRMPEFARMSLRPGIGGNSIHDVASVCLQWGSDAPDVPSQLRHGGKLMPLGRYLIRRLRLATGRLADAPQETLARLDEEVFDVRMVAKEVTRAPGMARFEDLAMAGFLLEKYKGKVAQVEGRQKLYTRRKDKL